MTVFLVQGMVLGFAAAATPGPFQAYLLTQVARKGWQRTLPAALAPLVSDGPIIVVMLLILSGVSDRALAIIQVAGGLFMLYLAYESITALRSAGPDSPESQAALKPDRGIWHASLMNLLNPNPYIFWGTVGGVTLLDAWRISPAHAGMFVGGMYSLLTGGLALFIILFGKIGALSPRTNRWLGGVSATVLCLFGLWQLGVGMSRIAV